MIFNQFFVSFIPLLDLQETSDVLDEFSFYFEKIINPIFKLSHYKFEDQNDKDNLMMIRNYWIQSSELF